jgi:hypothetical protein
LEANAVYLEEEIRNLRERIVSIRNFLKSNPSSSIYRRSINGRIYYYRKYRKGEKSVSEFLGNNGFDFKEAARKFKAENEKINKARRQLAGLKKDLLTMEKQVRIARKAFAHV